jgi:phosphoglycerate dehydrogenase-like enzyme
MSSKNILVIGFASGDAGVLEKSVAGKDYTLVVPSERITTGEQFLAACADYTCICASRDVLALPYKQHQYQHPAIYHLETGTVVFCPSPDVSGFDPAVLKDKRIRLGYSPGCATHSVSEWIVANLLQLSRKFGRSTGCQLTSTEEIMSSQSVSEFDVLLLGAQGKIGQHLSNQLGALDMYVYTYEAGNDLNNIADFDVVINCLSNKPTNKWLLHSDDFARMKRGSLFLSVTSVDMIDLIGLTKYVGPEGIRGAALDIPMLKPGDFGMQITLQGMAALGLYISIGQAGSSDQSFMQAVVTLFENLAFYLENGEVLHEWK